MYVKYIYNVYKILLIVINIIGIILLERGCFILKVKRVPFSSHVDEDLKIKFMELSDKTNTTRTDLLNQALNLLFSHYESEEIVEVFNSASEALIHQTDSEFLQMIDIPLKDFTSSQLSDYESLLETIIINYKELLNENPILSDDNKKVNIQCKIGLLDDFSDFISNGRMFSADIKRTELKKNFSMLNIITNMIDKSLQYIFAFQDLSEMPDFDYFVKELEEIFEELEEVKISDYPFINEDMTKIISLVLNDLQKIIEIDYENYSNLRNGYTVPTNIINLNIDSYHLLEIIEDIFLESIKTMKFNPSTDLYYSELKEEVNNETTILYIQNAILELQRKNEELTKKYHELNIRIDKLQEANNK